MIGPFPPILHRKIRKYVKYSRIKAQEYWLCIPSIFNEVRREKILFALDVSLFCAPQQTGGFLFFQILYFSA